MKKDYIQCGEIVGTHGINGEVRINPWCDSIEFLRSFKVLYLDGEGKNPLSVIATKQAKNVAIFKFENYDTVEQAQSLRGSTVYIKRDDANIGDRHFIEELIGCNVKDTDGKILGVLTDVFPLPANDVWQIKNGQKEYLFPAVDKFIKSIDIISEEITVEYLKGVFDDED